MLLSNLLYTIIILAGFPAGLILAGLCNEELKSWKKRLTILSLISLLISIAVYLTDFEFKIPIVITLFFIIIACLTIIWKSVN
ncbi:MAG: hypothetical protein AABX77_00445 [Nanoarchaeota archaeon]